MTERNRKPVIPLVFGAILFDLVPLDCIMLHVQIVNFLYTFDAVTQSNVSPNWRAKLSVSQSTFNYNVIWTSKSSRWRSRSRYLNFIVISTTSSQAAIYRQYYIPTLHSTAKVPRSRDGKPRFRWLPVEIDQFTAINRNQSMN